MNRYSHTCKKVRGFVLSILLCLVSTNSYSQESKKMYKEASKLIDVWLHAQRDYEDIPAVMGAIVKDQEILWSGSFGNANQEGPVLSTENTMTSICSTSKVFTATAIMKLVDQGKISLDDSVKDILPKYAVYQKFPKGGPVTVRSLLTHTSGLPRDTNHAYWGGPEHHFPTEDELFESASTQETTHSVGASIVYSNLGYSLLGLIIEKVTGVTYQDYMENHIFRPLNMSHSLVEMQSSLYGNKHAIGYTAINRNGKREEASFYQTRAMQPAAGISTTALDLAKFTMWQFRLADASKPEILQPSTLKSMHSTQAKAKKGPVSRGYGYQVFTDDDGHEWAMHGGICPGYVSFLKMDVTSKKAYIFLANANRIKAAVYVNGLIDILKRAEQIEPIEKNDVALSQYVGFYNLNPWNSEYYVAQWGDGLTLLYLPAESLKHSIYYYRHLEGDTFQLVEKGKPSHQQITFFRDAQGKVIKVKNEGNYHFRVNSR